MSETTESGAVRYELRHALQALSNLMDGCGGAMSCYVINDYMKTLTAQRAAAIAERDTAVRLLRAIEWQNTNATPCCPSCGNSKAFGHAILCQLAAIITTTPAQRGGEAR